MVEKIITSGKRKSSVARAIITDGKGNISFNGKDYLSLQMFDRLKMEEPVRIAKRVLGKLDFDVKITVRGGGEKSQIEAARLALARAIIEKSKSEVLKKEYDDYDWSLLVADVRRKEAYKPGDSKARKKRQSSKR